MSGSPFIPKQYGLIIPSKAKASIGGPVRRPVAALDDFELEESDEEQPSGPARPADEVAKRLEAQRQRTLQSTQLRDTLQKAISEDPTVFDYDTALDTIEQARTAERADDVARKPKYVNALLAKAEERKVERERVVIRTIQRERQREGEVFADKEEFVTENYRKKLEEERAREEEERRKGEHDVTKGDMSGFYRNLLNNNVALAGGIRSLPGARAAAEAAKATSEGETTEAKPAAPTAPIVQVYEPPPRMSMQSAPKRAAPPEEPKIDPSKFARKTDDTTAQSARERFLARKAAAAAAAAAEAANPPTTTD